MKAPLISARTVITKGIQLNLNKNRIFVSGLLYLLLNAGPAPTQPITDSQLAVSFSGGYGQLEIGGNYAGAEFHHSRPLPSRISFYYPVANSIDLSTDYWKRHTSHPFILTITCDGVTDTIGYEPFEYRYTPNAAVFRKQKLDYSIQIRYDFGEHLPVMAFRVIVRNHSRLDKEFDISTSLAAMLRTCQTYAFKADPQIAYTKSGEVFWAWFDETDTDSALIYVVNAKGPLLKGRESIQPLQKLPAEASDAPAARFSYRQTLAPDSSLDIIQLIGSCRGREKDAMISRVMQEWESSIQANHDRISHYTLRESVMQVGDKVLQHTVQWSKAVLATNQHYINGQIVPMPCPAEYNFFFTHDLVLTDLGAVMVDTDRVKKDLLYLRELTRPDFILPHAYYWQDDGYKTEFCGSDNWNHFWFIILTSSYLKHSGDSKTVESIFPILTKSVRLVLENLGSDSLMYATRPDWWDFGNLYGARAYVTILMIRALRDYAFLCNKLNRAVTSLRYITLANRMRMKLVEKLWDPNSGYLLNMLNSRRMDRHYYSGSLLAAVFDILTGEEKTTLLQTAERELLDPNLGIRNAMPANFHELADLYKFCSSEVGAPYVYANGGVWPHGTAWYILGLIMNNQPDKAVTFLRKFLTLEGIRNSPNGQPSFYEYRFANPKSPDYGMIDKPTFLWAGGWYLYALYNLAGVRENPWNISFDPNLPQNFEATEYDLMIYGSKGRLKWKGTGKYFKRIYMDNEQVYSAVVTQPAKIIELERGTPDAPYLNKANARIEDVDYTTNKKTLRVKICGEENQPVRTEIISPFPIRKVLVDGYKNVGDLSLTKMNDLLRYEFVYRMTRNLVKIEFVF